MNKLLSPLNRHAHAQRGINMVDLMMWLVIAALLLAAALQGIGYYQKNAYLYHMKNDALHAAESITAKVANIDGKFTADTVAAGVKDTVKSADVSIVSEAGASDAAGYVLRTTHPNVEDKDVVFLSKQRGSYAPGVHVVPKGTVIDADGGTTVTPPGGGTGGGGDDGGEGDGGTTPTTPIVDTTSVMNSTWNTLGACSTITIPLTGDVNATIEWGDGDTETVTTASLAGNLPEHDYGTAGSSSTNVKITGTFTGWDGWSTMTNSCLTKVDSWGDGTGTTSMSGAFYDATNLTEVTRIPKTATDISYIFYDSPFNGDISRWDTSNVETMEGAFNYATQFSGDISGWDTPRLTNTAYMFAQSGFSGDLSDWDMSGVTTINNMFSESPFNGDVSGWDTSSVEDMGYAFSKATNFNGDISEWETGSVTDMRSMFAFASAYNPSGARSIGSWDTSAVTNMTGMFSHSSFNDNIGGWDTSNVTMMSATFAVNPAFNQNLSEWNTSKVTNMSSMFDGATAFNSPLVQDGTGWNTSNVTTMQWMFKGATSFNQNINSWDVSKAVYVGMMFQNASSFNQPLNQWVTSSFSDVDWMFDGATVFNQNISGWDVSNTEPYYMHFATGSALTQANAPVWP